MSPHSTCSSVSKFVGASQDHDQDVGASRSFFAVPSPRSCIMPDALMGKQKKIVISCAKGVTSLRSVAEWHKHGHVRCGRS